MEITRRALERIKNLKGRQGVPKAAGVRLGLGDGKVYMKWDSKGPSEEDLVVVKNGFPIFIEARAYAHLADYILDFELGRGSNRFLLRRNHV